VQAALDKLHTDQQACGQKIAADLAQLASDRQQLAQDLGQTGGQNTGGDRHHDQNGNDTDDDQNSLTGRND
jgi:general stress protein YciG